MLPLTDFFRPKRFPVVTIALTVANLVVWLAYELPRGLERSALTLGFRPCEVTAACRDTELAWPLQLGTSMFTHGGWSHIVGNLVFLVVFGPRIEELLGRGGFLLTYVAAVPMSLLLARIGTRWSLLYYDLARAATGS